MDTYYCICESGEAPSQTQREEAEKWGIKFVRLWAVPDDYRNRLLIVDPLGTFCPWHYAGSVKYCDSVDEVVSYTKEQKRRIN